MPTEERWTPVWDTPVSPLDRRPGQAYGAGMPDTDPARYPHQHGTRYVLPCHLLSYGGLYEYVLIDVAQARHWLLAGPAQSFLTHPFLHRAFEDLMGFLTPPPQRGRLPALGYHDDALVFQLEGYETLPDLKRGDSRKVRQVVEAGHFTLGLLRRLA